MDKKWLKCAHCHTAGSISPAKIDTRNMARIEFSARVRREVWDRQKGHCAECKIGPMTPADNPQYDHILAAALFDVMKPKEMRTAKNCQLLCGACHRAKTNVDIGRIRKADRVKAKHIGGRKKSRLTHPYLKRKVDGTVVPR